MFVMIVANISQPLLVFSNQYTILELILYMTD